MLGTFTHFGNVLDLNGISVPAGIYITENKAEQGVEQSEQASVTLPFGVTFLGSSQTDATVLEIARRFAEAFN